ncbi:hypothetical protein IVB12_05380 [Bradyrhizobium sp. 179]|nr:hypothetical protein [Bradyrhizobium sp. 179]
MLWDDDAMSARLIAEELGTTRNAVLGKAHRLNLPDKKSNHVSLMARRIEVRRLADRQRPKPAPKSITVLARTKGGTFASGSLAMRPAGEFKAPKVNAGTSKTSPSYRNQLGFLPDMTVRERRDMLAEAVRNTAALPVEG